MYKSTAGRKVHKSGYDHRRFTFPYLKPQQYIMATQSKPHLLAHPVSSYVQKVKIALREKGIEFTTEVPSDISSTNDGPLHESNLRVEVPVLLHGDITIFDSTIILEYLEDVWPEPALLPKAPGERATARMIEDVCDTSYEAVNWVRSFLYG
jgi:glutathione S-transferase